MVQAQNQEWYDLLDIAAGGLFVTEIVPQLWGKEWNIGFIYEPLTDKKPFRIRFKDCIVGHWEFYGETGDERDEVADVIGFDFGVDQQGKLAVLNTDLFEVIIHYGALEIEKDW